MSYTLLEKSYIKFSITWQWGDVNGLLLNTKLTSAPAECGTVQQCSETHLYTLGVDLLAFLVPANPWLGVTRRLADKWDHAPWDANLVDWNFSEPWWCWGVSKTRDRHREGERMKTNISTNHKMNVILLKPTLLLLNKYNHISEKTDFQIPTWVCAHPHTDKQL